MANLGEDADAALHKAQPGKFKPATAPQPGAPAAGTLADSVERIPDIGAVRPTTDPLAPAPSLGEQFHAAATLQEGDNSDGAERPLREGYAKLLPGLGIDESENPAYFEENGLGNQLITLARYGMRSRADQEKRIADLIREGRAKHGASFMAGVPDNPKDLRQYVLAPERDRRAKARETLGRAEGGLFSMDTVAQFGGSAGASLKDPAQLVTMPIGGAGKTLVQVLARETLVNGALEVLQLPGLVHNRHALGEELTIGEAAGDVISAGVGGGAFEGGIHVAGKLGAKAWEKLAPHLPESVRARWAGKAADANAGDVFDDMTNKELGEVTRTLLDPEKMTPDEKAAAHTLDRVQEIGESSPYANDPAGGAQHTEQLSESINDLIERRRRETAAAPAPDPDVRATASERPLEATSTASERPQRFEIHRDEAPRDNAAPVNSEAAIAGFKNKTRSHESSNVDDADNPASSADGRYQITDGTFRGYFKRLFGKDPGAHPAKAVKNDPATQERIMDALTRDDAAKLSAIGERVTEGNLYLLHFAGEAGGSKILKADPSTPIERLLTPDAIAANPFLKGKSASEVIAWAHHAMGGKSAAVPASSAAGELVGASGGDPAIAQLRSEALQLDDQIAGLTRRPDGSQVNLYTRQVSSSAIGVDAKRFQFKSGGDDLGVTDRLKGVKEWDPGLAGRVTLWEDEGGKLWLADGHQRHGLARRISEESGQEIPLDAMILRHSDGVSADDARVWAALKNIAEGTGSAIDAAKVLRDGGEHLIDRLPPKSALVRDGGALAKLSDDAFGAVYNERIPADQAAVIGHLLPDRPETHAGMVALLIKLDPANRAQAQSIVRQAIAAGFHTEEQINLFGSADVVAPLFSEKAKVLERGLARLRKMRLVFNTAASEADTLEQAGSKIARSQSEKEAQANAEAVAIVDRLAYRAGPVADALGDAARELAGGARLSDATQKFIQRIRELDLRTLDGGDVGGGSSVDGSRLESDVGEADPSLFEEPSDPGQPSLIELEAATSRFSDPDGPAVQQQAKSLVHDLKADIAASNMSRRDRVKAATSALEGRGELRSIEPFPEEPGYHRFRYVAEDGTAVTGNYTVDGNLIEGFNIGDVHNKAALGTTELRRLFTQLHERHPEVQYVHGYRKSGARTAAGHGEEEIWLELTDKGAKLHRSDPRTPGGEPPLELPPAREEAPPAPIANDVAPAIKTNERGEFVVDRPPNEVFGETARHEEYGAFQTAAVLTNEAGSSRNLVTRKRVVTDAAGTRNDSVEYLTKDGEWMPLHDLAELGGERTFATEADATAEARRQATSRVEAPPAIDAAEADRLAQEFRDAVLPDGPPIDHDAATFDATDDHTDAERIIDHAMNLVAIKRGKDISPASHEDFDKLHAELAKLLGEANNVDAAVKRAVKAIEKGELRVHEEDLPPVEKPTPMPKSTLIPEPAKTVKLWENAGPVLSQAEAKAKVAAWKEEAKRIGRESPPPPNHFILSLFDSSGVWSQPYRDMGYHVLQLDLNHGHDLLQDIAFIQHAIDDLKAQGGHFAGAIAQPPCTTFAASGARWWEPRHNQAWSNAMEHMWGGFAAKEFQTPVEYNQYLVMATQEYIARAKPDFFVIENPVGRIEEMAGLPKPKLAIQPHNFGDAYTKRTHLWGEFNEKLETADVSPKEEDGGEGSKMHKLRSRDEKGEGLRSQTPEGFAYSFALANRPGTEARAAAPSGEAMLHGAGESALDLGEQVDPGKSANDRQIGALAAASPLGAPRDKPTLGEIGLELFDKANQPELTFRLSDDGPDMTAADLLKELDDDDKAIAALKGCL